MRAPLVLAAGAFCLVWSSGARALDKQGSAHGGDVGAKEEQEDKGVNLSGAASFGVAFFNPTYAARPDNTGLALFRYAGHADLDLIGRKLSIPMDINFFTDRDADGAGFVVPTELDVIAGVTSTWKAGPGAFEFGTRFEHDRPIDRGGFTQTYVDARARYLYSLASANEKIGKALDDGDVSGWVTLGWFAFNPTYAARPDNTGSALFRYALHTELSIWHDHISFGLDGTFFSDRREKNPLSPSELDLTPEIILRKDPFELHIAYERDMPIDRGGLVQHFAYLLAAWSFDLKKKKTEPLEMRGTIPSP